MDQKKVDVAIIGAGSAGLNARRGALSQGASVLMIDPGPFGTTCARVGCMPSKLLIAAAEAAHKTNDGEIFGLKTTLEVNGPKVMERVQKERDRFVGFVLESIEAIKARGELLVGHAKFKDPNHLIVDDQIEIEANAIVIAAGTTPMIPPPFRSLGDALLTNETIFEQKDLPKSLLVAGAGVIGLELGQAMSRLGVNVTLVDLLKTLGPLRDRKVIDSAVAAFNDEYNLELGYDLDKIERKDTMVSVDYTNANGEKCHVDVEKVLVATGRRSNLASLDIEKSGIKLDERNIPRFDPYTMQISDSHIFIAGDITGDRQLLHEAADEGKIAGENAGRFPKPAEKGHRTTSIGIVFTQPQLAIVGKGYSEIDEKEDVIGEVSYGNQGRARVMHENRGHVRIYANKASRKLIGAEMAGPHVENTAHLLAWAIQQEMTVDQSLAMPFYHPVLEEGIRTALRDLKANCDR